MNNVAGAAVTFKKAAEPEFKAYALQTMKNAKVLAGALMADGVSLITGGTDNHMMVMDTVKGFGIDGRVAQEALDRIGITANKQVIPDDPLPPVRPSGVRLGTPACTTRGMGEADMRRIAGWIVTTLRAPDDEAATAKTRAESEALCRSYPVPGID
jgi:glycine hydroxymethyltransferase